MENTGRIYEIISDSTDKIYIGSTKKTIERRLEEHEIDYKTWIDSDFKEKYCTSYEILKYGDYKIKQICEIEYNKRPELNKVEGKYQVENYIKCVNTAICVNKPKKILDNKNRERYTCYCGKEMYNKFITRYKHVKTDTHKFKVIENHKDIITGNEVDNVLDEILDEL